MQAVLDLAECSREVLEIGVLELLMAQSALGNFGLTNVLKHAPWTQFPADRALVSIQKWPFPLWILLRSSKLYQFRKISWNLRDLFNKIMCGNSIKLGPFLAEHSICCN